MAENKASWSDTAQELDEDDNLKFKLLIHEFTIPSSYNQLLLELISLTLATPGANKLNLSYSWCK